MYDASTSWINRSKDNFRQGDFLYEPVGNYFRPEYIINNADKYKNKEEDYEKRF